MRTLILSVLIISCAALLMYVVHAFRTTKRTASFIARWWPALIEANEWFALMEFDQEQSHFFQRHSPLLTADEIWQRSVDGTIEFSDTRGRAVDSARWLTHRDLLLSIHSACSHWDAGARPTGGAFNFAFEHAVGEGYTRCYPKQCRHNGVPGAERSGPDKLRTGVGRHRPLRRHINLYRNSALAIRFNMGEYCMNVQY